MPSTATFSHPALGPAPPFSQGTAFKGRVRRICRSDCYYALPFRRGGSPSAGRTLRPREVAIGTLPRVGRVGRLNSLRTTRAGVQPRRSLAVVLLRRRLAPSLAEGLGQGSPATSGISLARNYCFSGPSGAEAAGARKPRGVFLGRVSTALCLGDSKNKEETRRSNKGYLLTASLSFGAVRQFSKSFKEENFEGVRLGHPKTPSRPERTCHSEGETAAARATAVPTEGRQATAVSGTDAATITAISSGPLQAEGAVSLSIT